MSCSCVFSCADWMYLLCSHMNRVQWAEGLRFELREEEEGEGEREVGRSGGGKGAEIPSLLEHDRGCGGVGL